MDPHKHWLFRLFSEFELQRFPISIEASRQFPPRIPTEQTPEAVPVTEVNMRRQLKAAALAISLVLALGTFDFGLGLLHLFAKLT